MRFCCFYCRCALNTTDGWCQFVFCSWPPSMPLHYPCRTAFTFNSQAHKNTPPEYTMNNDTNNQVWNEQSHVFEHHQTLNQVPARRQKTENARANNQQWTTTTKNVNHDTDTAFMSSPTTSPTVLDKKVNDWIMTKISHLSPYLNTHNLLLRSEMAGLGPSYRPLDDENLPRSCKTL